MFTEIIYFLIFLFGPSEKILNLIVAKCFDNMNETKLLNLI